MSLSSLNLIGQSVFELESEILTDKRTKEQTELHQFRKEPSCDGDLCPCQV